MPNDGGLGDTVNTPKEARKAVLSYTFNLIPVLIFLIYFVQKNIKISRGFFK